MSPPTPREGDFTFSCDGARLSFYSASTLPWVTPRSATLGYALLATGAVTTIHTDVAQSSWVDARSLVSVRQGITSAPGANGLDVTTMK